MTVEPPFYPIPPIIVWYDEQTWKSHYSGALSGVRNFEFRPHRTRGPILALAAAADEGRCTVRLLERTLGLIGSGPSLGTEDVPAHDHRRSPRIGRRNA